MINFRKGGLIQQKSHKNAWVYAWKHENKFKGKGIKVLPALGEKNLAKSLAENDKKFLVEPCQVGERERKVWKSFEKVDEQVKYEFLKNLIHEFRLIEKQLRLIETDRDSLKQI